MLDPCPVLALKDIIHVTQLAPSLRSQKTHFQKALGRIVSENELQVRGWKSRWIPSKAQGVSYSVIKGRHMSAWTLETEWRAQKDEAFVFEIPPKPKCPNLEKKPEDCCPHS